MRKIPYGCIMLARVIKEKKIWTKKPSWWFKVWTYILMEVNHKNNPKFKRGTNFFTLRKIYNECCLYNEGIKEKSVGNFLKFAKTQLQITTQKTTRGLILTVCNYNFYQNLDNYKNDTENDMKNVKETPKKLQRNSTINNNDKNVKNVENDKNEKTYVETSKPFQLSKLLFSLIQKRDSKYKQPNFQKWSVHIDRLIRIDKRDPEEIKEVIEWCQEDDFEQINILSTFKLRKRYGHLRMKMKKSEEYI